MDEEQKVEPTSTEEASSSEELEEKEESDNASSVEDSETDNLADEDFHKTELERLKEKLGKKIDAERQKRVEAEKNAISIEEVDRRVREAVDGVKKEFYRNRAEEIAAKLASNPSEKELILHHYKNSIILSGNLEEDMEKAWAAANAKKFSSRFSTLKDSIKSKETRIGYSDAGAKIEEKKPVKYTQDVVDAAKFAGVSPEEFMKRMK